MRSVSPSTPARKIRCAIYTRKSTEEGLEQNFNSLDAQREACAAYIVSQRHEGWELVPDYYDDGGYSGGTLERPALKQLLGHIASDKVDVIVVYKVDRLTRSLADFAKIVDVLDEAKASFVSVTQSFNTTTSMGRLTLNVLLSFAQFEREVTGERIRDKIAASKAKGMWMGGPVPLGYDLQDRTLVINEAEAATIRHIFSRYLELGSGRALQAELEADGIRSKKRLWRETRGTGGKPISRGALYAILQNRLYAGEVIHKNNSYPGQHVAIIDQTLFDRVQAQLQLSRIDRKHQTNADEPSPLAGLLKDALGRPMSPTHAAKGQRRYRYYTSQNDGEHRQSPSWRLSASDIELTVCRHLRDSIVGVVKSRIGRGDLNPVKIERLERSRDSLVEGLSAASGTSLRELILRLVRSIVVHRDRLVMDVDLTAIDETLERLPTISVSAPLDTVRCGERTRLTISAASDPRDRAPNPALVTLVTQAMVARSQLMEPAAPDTSHITYSRDYATTLARLSYLAPDIISAILTGSQPTSLTRDKLIRATKLPLDWPKQRAMLGFD